MVWAGYFREQQAFENLSADPDSTVRHTTDYEDKIQALDIIKWSPLYGVEEGIQVKAPSFLHRVAKGDSGLLRKVIRCQQSWRDQEPDRYTYIYVDVTGEQVPAPLIVSIRYILRSMNITSVPTVETVGKNTYLIIAT